MDPALIKSLIKSLLLKVRLLCTYYFTHTTTTYYITTLLPSHNFQNSSPNEALNLFGSVPLNCKLSYTAYCKSLSISPPPSSV